MNEIDINIEGYNVNGICVGCLNYNRKMFYSDNVIKCLNMLGNIDVPDGLSVKVCWECLAAVNSTMRFQQIITSSYNVLIDYSRKNPFLNSPNDLTMFAQQRLSVHDTSNLIFCYEQEEVDLKPEKSVHAEAVDLNEELDLQFGNTDLKKDDIDLEDYKSNISSSEFPYNSPETKYESSEDDLSLSTLKLQERKSKRTDLKRKKLKKRREKRIKNDPELTKCHKKLKDFPKGTVELHTMTEEEMWRIRKEDVETKEFVRLKYKCDKCIVVFASEKLMNDHLQAKHVPKSPKRSQCDICRFHFLTKENLMNHRVLHLTSYKCIKCERKSPKSSQCDICQSHFLTKDNLTNHRALHLTSYKCTKCEIVSSSKRLMMKHISVHDALEFKCDMCDGVFGSKSKLAYHKRVCKEEEKPQCDCCGKVFANKVTLQYHLKPPSSKSDKEKEKLNLQCKGCDKVFPNKKSFRAHVVIHDGVTFPCPLCGKLFQWKRNLARHLRNHADRETGALHECRQCDKRFASRDCYNNHMKFSKQHVSEDSFVHGCEYCGKKFPTKWCLIDHVDWEHLNKIKYQCCTCSKAFKTAKIMLAHIKNIHRGKKKVNDLDEEHLCDICGKSYKTEKRLKSHVWAMHTHRSTSKSFKCKLCSATFTWQTSIYKHMKMMHDTKRNVKPQRSSTKLDLYNPELNRMQYFETGLIIPDLGSQNVGPIVQNL